MHMHQAALDARGRPCCGTGLLHAVKPVGDEHVGLGDAAEQGRVGRAVLMRAPLPVDGLAAGPVDGDDQAPAVGHVGAVGHDCVVDHPVRLDGRPDAPAPADPFAKGPGAPGSQLFLDPARQQQSRNSRSWKSRARFVRRMVDVPVLLVRQTGFEPATC